MKFEIRADQTRTVGVGFMWFLIGDDGRQIAESDRVFETFDEAHGDAFTFRIAVDCADIEPSDWPLED